MNWYVFGFIMLYITLVIGVIIPFIPLKGHNWLYRGFQTWGIPSRHEMVVAILKMVIHDDWVICGASSSYCRDSNDQTYMESQKW